MRHHLLGRALPPPARRYRLTRPPTLSALACLSTGREGSFGRLRDSDINQFRRILQEDAGGIVEDPGDLQRYNRDWTGQFQGQATIVLRPASEEQLKAILGYCQSRRLSVVPQGGNTGLVGGSVPVHDELIISLERLASILSHDEERGLLTVQAGCILATAEAYLAERGFILPLDLGAKGSCTLGGTVATNAGGVRFLRYGSMHGNVTGLRAILADGRVVDDLVACRKSNTGYDLKQLFIGSEGTLGIVSAVSLITPPAPQAVNVALFAVRSYADIQNIFKMARSLLGEILSAFEFWDRPSMDLLIKHSAGQGDEPGPLEGQLGEGSFFVLVETHGSSASHDGEKMMNLLGSLQAEGLVLDGTMAQDTSQAAALWHMRESLPEVCARRGPVIKFDVSLPRADHMYTPVERLREQLLARHPQILDIVGFGHYGDGNVHINVIMERRLDGRAGAAEETTAEVSFKESLASQVYQLIGELGGSISAEHGIGQLKLPYLSMARPALEISLMRSIKDLLDPMGILNPYKVLPRRQ